MFEGRPGHISGVSARPFALISDHFHPGVEAQGQSPFVWSVLGGTASRTERLEVGTGLTSRSPASTRLTSRAGRPGPSGGSSGPRRGTASRWVRAPLSGAPAVDPGRLGRWTPACRSQPGTRLPPTRSSLIARSSTEARNVDAPLTGRWWTGRSRRASLAACSRCDGAGRGREAAGRPTSTLVMGVETVDCDSCGRHRPSAEIAPLRGPGGRLVMACVRCRRLAIDEGDPSRSGPRPRAVQPVS